MLVYWNTTNLKFHYRTAQYETRTLGGVRGALRHLMAEPSTRLCVEFNSYSMIRSRSSFFGVILNSEEFFKTICSCLKFSGSIIFCKSIFLTF